MKTYNRLVGNTPTITESPRIVLLVMNSAQDELEYAQRLATGNLTDADKAKAANNAIIDDKAKADAKLAEEAETKRKADEEVARIAAENNPPANDDTLDKDGNLVDKEGKVVKTKEELATEAAANNNDDLSLVEELIVKSGVELKDEHGQPKVYEESVEGVFSFANDLAEVKAQKEIDEFFEQMPEVKDFADFMMKGGKKEDYFKVEKVSNVDITDEKGQEDAVLKNFKLKGFDDKKAKTFLKMIIDSNTLEAEAKDAEKELKAYDDNVEKRTKLEREEAFRREQQEVKEHWKGIENIDSKGQLVNYTIPDAERSNFFDYISRRVDNNGNTQISLAKAKMPVERHLELDYLIFKGFDFSKLVKSEINKEKVKSLKERIGRNAGVNSANDTKIEHQNQIDTSNMSIEDVHKYWNAKKENQK